MDPKLTALIQRLTKWYWSPNFPTTYLVNGAGLGRVALSDPGAFNLTWAKYSTRLNTLEGQQEAVAYFSLVGSRLKKIQLNGEPLSDYACLQDQGAFTATIREIQNRISVEPRSVILSAFNTKV